MNPDEYGRAAAVFLAIVVVIAGTVALVGTMRSTDSPGYAASSPSQYQPENALATVSNETGEITVEGDAESKTVLIDRSHQNRFSPGEIEPLVSALVENGHTVRYYGSGGAGVGSAGGLNASLRRADAFVVINPVSQFRSNEVNGLEAFAEGGGRVLVLGNPSIAQSGVLGATGQLDPGATNLVSGFGATLGSGYLYNMRTDNRDNYFKSIYARPSGQDPLTEGVNRVVFRDAAPITTGDEASVLLTGVEGTQLSSTRKAGDYGVLARSGNFTLVGDSSFLAPGSVYDASNEELVGNLAEFLVTGEKAECIFPSATGGLGSGGIGSGGIGSGGGFGSGQQATPSANTTGGTAC